MSLASTPFSSRMENMPRIAHPDHAAGEGGVGDQHQRVERIPVAGQGVGHEAVVRRVGGGGEEAAVQPDHVLLVVVLVLVAAARGDLDHHVDHFVGPRAHCGCGCLAAVGVVRRAHDADPVPVRIAHDGVAGAPERVEGLLLDRHPVGRQLGHQVVDLLAGVDLEPEHRAGTAGPTLVPLGGEGLTLSRSTSIGAPSPGGRDVVVSTRPGRAASPKSSPRRV